MSSTHYLCHWFPDSASFPVFTTPSHDAPARPLLRVSLSAIQPTLVASRYIPSWFCMIQFNQITMLTVNNYHIHVNNNANTITGHVTRHALCQQWSTRFRQLMANNVIDNTYASRFWHCSNCVASRSFLLTHNFSIAE